MKTKLSIHGNNYNKILEKSKESIGEIVYYYISQFDAYTIMEGNKDKKHRILFDILLDDKSPHLWIKEIKELSTVYSNITFRLPQICYPIIKECNNIVLPIAYAARTLQEAFGMFNAGLREVYVTGSLAANMEDLKQLRQYMRIRLVPNIAQTDACVFGNPWELDPLYCFWVRPEAISLYDGVVDYMEFLQDETHNEVGLIDIYASGKWTGNLGDVIIDRTGTLDRVKNEYPIFYDKYRSQCKLRCQRNNTCHTCQNLQIRLAE